MLTNVRLVMEGVPMCAPILMDPFNAPVTRGTSWQQIIQVVKVSEDYFNIQRWQITEDKLVASMQH